MKIEEKINKISLKLESELCAFIQNKMTGHALMAENVIEEQPMSTNEQPKKGSVADLLVW